MHAPMHSFPRLPTATRSGQQGVLAACRPLRIARYCGWIRRSQDVSTPRNLNSNQWEAKRWASRPQAAWAAAGTSDRPQGRYKLSSEHGPSRKMPIISYLIIACMLEKPKSHAKVHNIWYCNDINWYHDYVIYVIFCNLMWRSVMHTLLRKFLYKERVQDLLPVNHPLSARAYCGTRLLLPQPVSPCIQVTLRLR